MAEVQANTSARLRTYEAPTRTIAVIDPDPRMRDVLSRMVHPMYRAADFADVQAAIGRTQSPPAALLVGEAAEGARGRGPIALLREQPMFRNVPVVLLASRVGSRRSGQDAGPDAVVQPPYLDLLDVVARLGNSAVEAGWANLPAAPREALRRTLAMFGDIAELVGTGRPLEYGNVSAACAPVLDAVKQAGQGYVFEGLRNHNHLNFVHSLRVSTMLALFGFTIGLDDPALMTLASAGLVHDIGKTVLPDKVMNKVGSLDDSEKKIAHSHVDVTVKYLEKHSDVPRPVVAIAGQHHERLDGSGYPNGLAGDQINDLSRMAAIVDVFCALTERRPHRAAMGPFQALEVMQENVRAKLDQRLVRMFSGMLVNVAA